MAYTLPILIPTLSTKKSVDTFNDVDIISKHKLVEIIKPQLVFFFFSF